MNMKKYYRFIAVRQGSTIRGTITLENDLTYSVSEIITVDCYKSRKFHYFSFNSLDAVIMSFLDMGYTIKFLN